MRKPIAFVCLALLVVAALVPTVVFVTAPLIAIATLTCGDEYDTQPLGCASIVRPALVVLTSSRHLPRASLLPVLF